ncbi:hypothetical protein [Dyadobacter sp. Leaf189]|uniref:hypothetical protein n=1 Tax=Dyadobacter sp. Leaf189 TaxID=1736295 RepID=UPI0006FE52CA|nr:hypothetical protein [Dyadobacter sp. Leaf189]KQS32929.1 hypothetical protein ASG33_02205 [Dyadobacter sp. Leaf189]
MTLHRYYIIAVLLAFGLSACEDNKKQQELDVREQRISQREREFALKEADYKSLLEMRDSLLSKKDTAIILHWPDEIAGLWNAKSICRESNCPEYVIGDQRFNSWEFISDSTGLYTRVMSNDNQLVRVYNARFDSTGIVLNFASDSSATKNMVLNVELARVNQALMKGQQMMNINQACNSKFSLELTRPTTK